MVYLFIAILLAGSILPGILPATVARAEDPAPSGAKGVPVAAETTAGVKDMQGSVCPVSSGPMDRKISYIYKGTKYYFCCPMCVDKFKASPEKYIKNTSGNQANP